MVERTSGSHQTREGRGRWPSVSQSVPGSIPANASSTWRSTAVRSRGRSRTRRKATWCWWSGCGVRRASGVGIEASGGYEQAVVAELRRQRFVVVVFQPAQVRAYAVFHLQRAKNDRIDAALIAACTAAVKKIHPAPDPRLLPFAAHLTMIEQIG